MKIQALLAEKNTKRVEGVTPDATLKEAAQKLIDLRIGALVVCDPKDKLVGIVSERDLLPAVADSDAMPVQALVDKVMTRTVITCQPEDEVSSILRLMNANSIRHIPVTVDGALVDMISIRELTKAYDLLQKEADTDPLTELSNRRPFLRRLDLEYARAKRYKLPLTVAMIDLDNFKRVNDTHGHDAGDQVLRATSAMLINEFRNVDLVGRLGGEEFSVVFPETSVEKAQVACTRLLEKIASTVVPVGRAQINVTVSIGLAGLLPSMVDGASVLKQADELLYDAKRAGRNCIKTCAINEMDIAPKRAI